MNALLVIFLLGLSAPALALTPELNVYMRAGTGSNDKGGGQECVSNKGSSGNEFRLGNECGIYGEFSFNAPILKAENDQAPFWRLHSNFAFAYDNRTDWEPGNNNAWILREMMIEGGHVDGLEFDVWAGKRFYRWGDVHMNDLFAVDMSGPGGGVGGIKTSYGTWSAALIQNTSSNELNGTGTGVVTSVGSAAKTTLHLRLDEMVTPAGTWSYWLTGGTTPSTKSTTTDYKSTSGVFLAIKNNLTLGFGTNEWGVAAGQDAMSNLSSQGNLVKDCPDLTKAECTVSGSQRIRIWENYTFEQANWSVQTALVYEDLNKGTSTDARVRWTSLGVRPIYWFTDHLGLAFQAGISNVVDESDGFGSRNLTRVTIAPQMSMGKGFYNRPVIRAYYSRTSWNENNKISAATTSFADSLQAESLGVQTEVWF